MPVTADGEIRHLRRKALHIDDVGPGEPRRSDRGDRRRYLLNRLAPLRRGDEDRLERKIRSLPRWRRRTAGHGRLCVARACPPGRGDDKRKRGRLPVLNPHQSGSSPLDAEHFAGCCQKLVPKLSRASQTIPWT